MARATARYFCQFDLDNEPIPDATTLENLRHLLEQHRLGEQLFAAIGDLLLLDTFMLNLRSY